jgi:hypothetical protein
MRDSTGLRTRAGRLFSGHAGTQYAGRKVLHRAAGEYRSAPHRSCPVRCRFAVLSLLANFDTGVLYRRAFQGERKIVGTAFLLDQNLLAVVNLDMVEIPG